jgi:hypothetical protein
VQDEPTKFAAVTAAGTMVQLCRTKTVWSKMAFWRHSSHSRVLRFFWTWWSSW